MVYKFFDSKVASPDKKSEGSDAKHVNTKLIPQNEQLADELHKPIIRIWHIQYRIYRNIEFSIFSI